MNLALPRPPLPWIASASPLALVAVLAAAIIQPMALLVAGGTAAFGAALALAAPWRRFHAATAAARAAFIGS